MKHQLKDIGLGNIVLSGYFPTGMNGFSCTCMQIDRTEGIKVKNLSGLCNYLNIRAINDKSEYRYCMGTSKTIEIYNGKGNRVGEIGSAWREDNKDELSCGAHYEKVPLFDKYINQESKMQSGV